MIKDIGIYRILNIKNGTVYIGSSVDIKNRIGTHKSKLRNKKHENSHLQRDFNSFSLDAFDFEVIQLCSENELEDAEKFFIDLYKANTYNNLNASLHRYKSNISRKQIGITLNSLLLNKLKKEAELRNRSVTNLIETILKKELDLL